MARASYRLLPLAELSREIGSPYDLLYRLVKARTIRPDQIAGRQLLFRSDRLVALLPVLQASLAADKFARISQGILRIAEKGTATI